MEVMSAEYICYGSYASKILSGNFTSQEHNNNIYFTRNRPIHIMHIYKEKGPFVESMEASDFCPLPRYDSKQE